MTHAVAFGYHCIMDRQAIEKKLYKLVEKRFKQDISGIGLEDDFFDKLGIDSFQAVEILSDLEEAFDVEIPDYELQGVTTFGALASLIATRV